MANTVLKGRVIFADGGQGIPDLTVHAVDEHTLPDHDLGKTKTVDGNVQLDYGPGGYTRWEGGLNPNIRVRIYGPIKRVLYDRTFDDVSAAILDLGIIKIHSNNVANKVCFLTLKLFDDLSLLGNEYAAAARLNTLIETNPSLRASLQVVPVFEVN